MRVSATVMWQEPSLASSSLKRELLIRASVPTRRLPLCEGERKPKIWSALSALVGLGLGFGLGSGLELGSSQS